MNRRFAKKAKTATLNKLKQQLPHKQTQATTTTLNKPKQKQPHETNPSKNCHINQTTISNNYHMNRRFAKKAKIVLNVIDQNTKQTSSNYLYIHLSM